MTELDTSDDALALEFAKRAERVGIVYSAKKGWLVWDPISVDRNSTRGDEIVRGIWRPDDTMRVMRLIRDVCRDVAARTEPKIRIKTLSWAKMTTVEKMARSDQRLEAVDLYARAARRRQNGKVTQLRRA